MALKKEVKRVYWGLAPVDSVKNLIVKYLMGLL
jgi:hypothetical protein